ncbi:MAG: NAD(P)-dependent oxidoreductase [Candidatus Eremiobacteraeota bacterium]|nr:NAD(P)-dependent oxidoreductase [Candidatus Eremiobacteraeota bacterium]
MASSERVGVVGAGRMGANIARRLKDVGYHVASIYDSKPDVSESVAHELGAEPSKTLSRVVEHCDTIITVVTDDTAMRSVFASSGDSLLNGCKGRLFVNCATITPQVHVDIEKLAEERGAQSLEACMASSIPQAREGTLYLMVGGRREAFERAKPMLEKMSSSLKYIGPAGTAAKVKALVNMVMNINTAGLAEGLGLGEALGLDLDVLRAVFAETGAGSRVLVTDGEDMQNRAHECYFSAAHAAKDSGIAQTLAREAHLNLPLAQATKEQFDRMVASGLGELDKSGIAELTFKSRRAREGALA